MTINPERVKAKILRMMAYCQNDKKENQKSHRIANILISHRRSIS
jgi:hypothetical protein